MKMEQQHGRVFLTRLLESPGYVDPNTLSLKTWQISLVDPTGSDMCSEELPKSGTMRNGKLYERQTLAHHIKEHESGLWPIPDASPRGPRAIDLVENSSTVKRRGSGQKRGIDLQTAVKVWPTPRANDANHSSFGTPSFDHRRDRGYMAEVVMDSTKKTKGSLNPDWVEWLMNFPIGWTDLEVEKVGETLPFTPEPDIPRITTKSKNRANRLKCLGNALVPQIAELIGEMIINDNDTQTRKAQEEVKAPEKAR